MGPEILISPAIGVAKDAISTLWRRFRKPDQAQLIERRQRLKAEVESHLRWIDNSVRHGQAIIRDVKRADEYPNVDEKSRGISAWYKLRFAHSSSRITLQHSPPHGRGPSRALLSMEKIAAVPVPVQATPLGV
jgi:hypothetical protein